MTLTDRNGTHLDIAVGGDRFTSYHYAEVPARPYFHPVVGPGGALVTRGFPMEPDVPGETHDHPHHRGLYFAHGEVNETNNWSEVPGHATMQHRGFARLTSGPVQGSFTQALDWLDTAGAVVLTEQRTVTVYHTSDDERLLDAALAFRASAGAVLFGDTKEGGLISVRVATSMDAKEAGRIENAAGGIQEAETWGKRAQWCDYSGPVAGQTLGICLMDHPENPRHPTHWHVRNYGLMTANPFGRRDYTRDPAQRGDLLLQDGARLNFRYRVLIHRGNAQDADLHARYQDLAHPTGHHRRDGLICGCPHPPAPSPPCGEGVYIPAGAGLTSGWARFIAPLHPKPALIEEGEAGAGGVEASPVRCYARDVVLAVGCRMKEGVSAE